MTGKLANTVMAIRNGEQIVRAYQPVVANPSTPAQVEARAKLKLMSQMAAVMAPVIAIPRMGAVSSRNLFIRKNYGSTSFDDGTASITLTQVQLTSSVIGLSPIDGVRTAEVIGVDLVERTVPAAVDRVVYAEFAKMADGRLRFVDSKTSSDATTGFHVELALVPEEVVIYAYGVRDNTEAARATFGNLQTITAETVAKLITSRVLLESDVTLTETVAIQIAPAA